MAEAIEIVRSKRTDDGRWLLDYAMPAHVIEGPTETIDEPSRWNTLHALRVLRWWESDSN
jgi:hypothetical protein